MARKSECGESVHRTTEILGIGELLHFARSNLPESCGAAQTNIAIRIVPLQILEGLDDARH